MRSPGGLDEGMVRSFALMKIVSPCWKLSQESRGDDSSGRFGGGRADGLLWYKDLGRHAGGEFSMAVVQANNLLEDGSQIESGPLSLHDSSPPHGTFVGVYDGHGGPEASKYITNNLFWNLKKYASEQQGMSVDVIQKAFSATEEGFISLVRKQWLTKPQLASVGSCCLIGVICGGMLYMANLGDSRAVLARLESDIREVKAVQLSTEHNASFESIREELHSMHPDDSQIVVLKHNVWRVKGLIQVSKSIGDAYLKDAEFNREPLLSRFRLPEPFCKSILSAEPTIVTHKLCPEDQFLIFASDGLWEHLSNQEAVEIVHNSPRSGIARKLVKAAMKEAAKKREMRYSDLKKIDRGIRRHFHDDITVIVIFLDHTLISKNFYHGPVVSLRGGGNPV
ncbi:probable protein phosphatase 2C 38 [Elaeis guineensis]|uniref:protein-serine/threonine phosphatase n=1 Tax=Elaeis guineensis var. tenera TaxID=51953 RepID=A0A6I9S621_ELAGV|nr:probable protein phosphatase 2C 38 [Elaeis guineensis]